MAPMARAQAPGECAAEGGGGARAARHWSRYHPAPLLVPFGCPGSATVRARTRAAAAAACPAALPPAARARLRVRLPHGPGPGAGQGATREAAEAAAAALGAHIAAVFAAGAPGEGARVRVGVGRGAAGVYQRALPLAEGEPSGEPEGPDALGAINLAAMHHALLATYAAPPQVRRRGPRTPPAPGARPVDFAQKWPRPRPR